MSGLAFTNPQVQRLRRLLGRRSARRDEGAFVIEGAGLVSEAIAAEVQLEVVYVADGADVELAPLAGVPVVRLAPGVLERVAPTVSPQPVLAVARSCAVPLTPLRDGWALVAAGIADPGNLGTILRVAEAAGASKVVLVAGTVDPFGPKVVRASAGALFHVPISVDVALGDVGELGVPLWATAARGGVAYTDAPFVAPLALVLGNEAHGVADELAVVGTVSIPHVGRAESLNVAMAAAVLSFELARRLRPP